MNSILVHVSIRIVLHLTTPPAEASVPYGELPGGAYAVVTIPHTAEAVGKAWAEICHEWAGST
ncbi:hypothetical protein [Paenibacillus sp. FSL H8-0332]|uniref:hypothetical protein n=1 Tax=Paenibacillus sp. FSL H8-0332 TaxID=2954742 RepID=UPI0030D35AB4